MIVAKSFLNPTGSIAPRPPRLIMFTVFIVPMLLLLFHHYPQALPPSFYLNRCGRVVLISAARHGSTWFIQCAEGCPLQEEVRFGHANKKTELWVDHYSGKGADIARDLTPETAVEYVRNNLSLKIMPLTAQHEDDLRTFFGLLDDSIPVFVLRRNLEDAYASFKHAKATGVWMRNRVNRKDRARYRKIVKDDEFFGYQKNVERYFEKVGDLMREKGVVWDEIDYDQATQSRIIVGEKQGCYLRNCNFL